jgi:CRISPR-associated protein Csh1
MLDTLYKFGRQLSQNSDREEFDDQIAAPPIGEKEISKGIRFFIASIIFDLDTGTFRLDENPKPFSQADKSYKFSPYNLRCIKIQGGNNKSIYPTVDPRKAFDQWQKTFFGKRDKDGNPPKQAELTEAIQKDFPDLANTVLYNAVKQIFKMRDAFEAAYPDWKKVSEDLKMDGSNRVAMLSASVVSAEMGISEPCPVVQLDGYDDFLRRKFLQKGGSLSADDKKLTKPKLCYVTGELRSDVSKPLFDNRYSLNYMFVKDKKNYATGFEDKDFYKNYQAGIEAQVFLERGSAHFLKRENVVQIAGLYHCIVPQFLANQKIDLDVLTTSLKKKSELLFQMTRKQIGGLLFDLDNMSNEGVYWLTFLGFESDGNYFKSINRIEDVSKTHFEKVFEFLEKVETEMSETEGVQWENVMTYGKEQNRFFFNFYTIYNLIPVKNGKRNDVLILFKAILEQRPVFRKNLFEHFIELVKCHWFQRKSADNVKPIDKKNFDFATRDAVFQYHAFFQFLKKIKLLDMDDKTPVSAATLDEKNASISAFFERMAFTDDQRSVFYLGRILNNVGYAQHKKGHPSKPILGKVNFNGMESVALKRLYADLFEKCKQYDILRSNEGNFSKFTDLFKDEVKDKWDKRMKPDETLFYLLSGYSFRTSKESTEGLEGPETTTEI